MTTYSTTTNTSTPEVFIANNKNRLKVYDGKKIYLNDNQEFQFEFHNPRTANILAKISINGIQMQGGLVIRPGQRVWLERYLNEARKFVFNTYDVANTESNKKAIEQNGKLKIEFFDENTPSWYYSDWYPTWRQVWVPNLYPTYPYNPWITYDTTAGKYNCGNTLTSSGKLDLDDHSIGTADLNDSSTFDRPNSFQNNNTFNCCNVSQDAAYFSNSNNLKSKNRGLSMDSETGGIETGRIEKGNESNQQLKDTHNDFYSWSFHTVEYQILPLSQKELYTSDDLRKYCTNCRLKITNKPWVYCPKCGTKIE